MWKLSSALALTEKYGVQTQNSSLLVQEGDIMHFLVTASKQPQYRNHCNFITCADDPTSTILKYTEHTTELYAKINLCLASDSPSMKEYSAFIPELRASILAKPLLEHCFLYRGVDLRCHSSLITHTYVTSQQEVDEMEKLGTFFIPSFTSTSVDPTKAYAKDTTLVIKTNYCSKYACSITADLSKYYSTGAPMFHQRLILSQKKKFFWLVIVRIDWRK